MSVVFKKMNLKEQSSIVVLDAPKSFEPELQSLRGVKVHRTLGAVREIDFVLAFATQQKQIDDVAATLNRKAQGDAIVWFAYPKGTSKRYTCDFNRDTGWKSLGKRGFEGVRMVAIDEDWSAVRFRRVEFIKTINRAGKRAISAEGKARAAKKK